MSSEAAKTGYVIEFPGYRDGGQVRLMAQARCFHCGAKLDVPSEALMHVVFTSGGGNASECVLTLDGRAVHRCPLRPLRFSPPASDATRGGHE